LADNKMVKAIVPIMLVNTPQGDFAGEQRPTKVSLTSMNRLPNTIDPLNDCGCRYRTGAGWHAG
jgi:hypothetical protein